MSGYHRPRLPSQELMQPPHPQASSAHLYQQQQQQQYHCTAGIASSGTTAHPQVSYPYHQQQQQATASAPPPAADEPQSRLLRTQRAMQENGYPSWGFVVYRGAYGDDVAWNRYLAHLKHEVAQAADSSPSGNAIHNNSGGENQQPPSQSLEWTVMDDRKNLENASLEAVRQDFALWVSTGGCFIDQPGNPPRYTHCVYVDQKCLDTLAPFENWIRLDRHGPIQFLACILIDGQVPVDEQAAATGKGYPGWMYANVGSLPELYETLGQMHLWDPGNDVYCMPPWIYPGLRKMKR